MEIIYILIPLTLFLVDDPFFKKENIKIPQRNYCNSHIVILDRVYPKRYCYKGQVYLIHIGIYAVIFRINTKLQLDLSKISSKRTGLVSEKRASTHIKSVGNAMAKKSFCISRVFC